MAAVGTAALRSILDLGPRIPNLEPKCRRASRLLALLVFINTASADHLEFKAGGRVELPARIVGRTVHLDAPGGPYAFDRDLFRSIVPSTTPEHEWPALRAKSLSGDAESKYQAARWALLHGLTPEAVAMLLSAHEADPRHQPTAEMIAVLDLLAAPRDDPDIDRLRRRLGGSWRMARGPHAVLFHQHDAAEAAERIEAIERVITSYHLLLASQGFDLTTPATRLASAWFARRSDYLAFLQREGGGAFNATRGYHHPSLDLVVAHDARDRGAEGRLDRSIRAIASRGSEAERPDLDRRRLLLELDRRALDLGVAAHETVHQLVARSGFAPRPESFPLWLHEGFAAQFEVVRGGRWSGIGDRHALRLADWPRDRPPSLISVLKDEGFGKTYRADAYVAAWSLVDYLHRERTAEWLSYLGRLHSSSPSSPRGIAAFLAAFGDDLSDLEASWHRHVATLRQQPHMTTLPGAIPRDSRR